RLLDGALERFGPIVEAPQAIEPDPRGAVVAERAHPGIRRELRLAFEHGDEVAIASLPLMQPLQRVDGRTGARLDLERVLVELDRAEEVAAMRLEQTRARGEHRRPMPGIGAHGVGLVPERAFEHVPRAGEGRRADDPANARRIELTELPGLVERGARSLG